MVHRTRADHKTHMGLLFPLAPFLVFFSLCCGTSTHTCEVTGEHYMHGFFIIIYIYISYRVTRFSSEQALLPCALGCVVLFPCLLYAMLCSLSFQLTSQRLRASLSLPFSVLVLGCLLALP